MHHLAASIKILKNEAKTKLASNNSKFSEEAASLSTSYYDFIKAAWQEIEGTNPYVDGWHIQAICEHLEALKNGQIKT